MAVETGALSLGESPNYILVSGCGNATPFRTKGEKSVVLKEPCIHSHSILSGLSVSWFLPIQMQ